jgi:hypothetical protein
VTNEHWKTGIELELMSPVGSSRRHLAQALAEEYTGHVVEFFHPEAEHGISTHNPVFQNLTQGFRVIDSYGFPVADLVDDLTLQQDLNKKNHLFLIGIELLVTMLGS